MKWSGGFLWVNAKYGGEEEGKNYIKLSIRSVIKLIEHIDKILRSINMSFSLKNAKESDLNIYLSEYAMNVLKCLKTWICCWIGIKSLKMWRDFEYGEYAMDVLKCVERICMLKLLPKLPKEYFGI